MRYDQLVVYEGCTDGNKELLEEKYRNELQEMCRKLGFKKPKIIGVVKTVTGRFDFFFCINNKDVDRFALWRLQYGMRWWEDICANNDHKQYPKEIRVQYPPRW